MPQVFVFKQVMNGFNGRSMPFLAMGLLMLLMVLFAIPFMVPGAAQAQSRAEINQKIENLEKQLQAVQRRVFNGDGTYFPQNENAPAAVATESLDGGLPSGGAQGSPLLASMSVQINELERQLLALTGQIEELQFENRRLTDRLDRFEKDTALRLQMLEGTAGAGLPANAGAPQGAAASANGPRGLIATPTPEDAQSLLNQPAGTAADLQAQNTQSPPSQSPQARYDAAYDLLRRGQFEPAEKAFQGFLGAHRDHALAGNAQYWLGESFYVRGDYGRAAQAFLTGYQDYGTSSKAPDSLLKLGMTLAALGQTSDACAAFDELDQRYPDAEKRIKNLMASERSRLSCS